ncbi:MAG: polysaccharide biosynthesis protein, partial [Oscillospiraceae bacterium]
MNKYKRLLSNTVLFGISSFSSKILILLLMPFYTSILNPAEKAVTDQILKSGNLLIPLVSIGIANAVIRYGLDKAYKKEDVFTSG